MSRVSNDIILNHRQCYETSDKLEIFIVPDTDKKLLFKVIHYLEIRIIRLS